MFGLEPWHIVLLLAVVLVIFGPKRLPEIGKSVGETIKEFRKATTDIANSATNTPAAPPAQQAPIPAPPPPAASAPTAPPPPAVPAPAPSDQPLASADTDRPPASDSAEPAAAPSDAASPNPPAGTAG